MLYNSLSNCKCTCISHRIQGWNRWNREILCERVSPASWSQPHYRSNTQRHNTALAPITGIHQSTLITDRFIHSCARNAVLLTVYYVYRPPHTGGKLRERIYNHPTGKGKGGWGDKNLLILGKFLKPDVEIPVILERNCWFCRNCAWQNRRGRVSMCGNLRLGHISTEKISRLSSQIDRR